MSSPNLRCFRLKKNNLKVFKLEEETMIHPETGEILRRDVRPVEYEYKGEKITVDMPGWYPVEGTDGICSMEDMKVASKALEILKARHKNFSRNDEFNFANAAVV